MRLILLCLCITLSAFAEEFEPKLTAISELSLAEIKAGNIPGAVVLVGNRTKILYRQAHGLQTIEPQPLSMTPDTVFDLASLTKVVATTTAIMQLLEKKKLRLEDPVARYWPQFASHHKQAITIRQLLTHYSGLRADLNLRPEWSGYHAAMQLIVAEKPISTPGSDYNYSDINFEILGELVRRLSGETLNVYCARHIFRPLAMQHTGFKPAPQLGIAPTQYRNDQLLRGVVHDPAAFRMGGVAGHAGLFSTADDLAIFARMLLNGGTLNGVQILSRDSVEKMSIPQSPPGTLRGLGWSIAAPFTANREQLIPAGSYGHRGYTGTLLWIDPVSQTFLIVLTNRVHPDGKGDAEPLRKGILGIVSANISSSSDKQILEARPALADWYVHQNKRISATVATGLEVWVAEKFAALDGLNVGVITNQTGIDSAGTSIISLLKHANKVRLKAIFSPEHGIHGNRDEAISSGMDAGIPVYSLYGKTLRPTGAMLNGLDALVFDIQDAGVRFYTYATTMAYAMEAAAQQGIDFYVLDRPDPITANIVQGPMLDANLKSFTGYFPLPVRHGMTIGELASLYNDQAHIGAKLHVIKMRGYHRNTWYDNTGLQWISPSPNLRTLTQAILYPGVALVEGAELSVGRGTDTPFELLGAPWINGQKLANYLNRRNLKGVFFIEANFTPDASAFQHQRCHGLRLLLTDRQLLDSPLLGVELASALYQLYPAEFKLPKILGMVGNHQVLQDIANGVDPKIIAVQWQDKISEFSEMRKKYLLY